LHVLVAKNEVVWGCAWGSAGFIWRVNNSVYTVGCGIGMVQVQVRMPEKLVEEIDRWVDAGRFSSRSEAIKMAVTMYQESEKTKEFYKMLMERSREAREKPETLRKLT